MYDQHNRSSHGRQFSMGDTEKFWAGEFGDDYVERNAQSPIGNVRANVELFGWLLFAARGVRSIIEFGAGAGQNLHAIRQLNADIKLTAIEINEKAAARHPLGTITLLGSILDERDLEPSDMAFTKGLLIHIPPEDLPRAYDALYKAARRFILVVEYYSPTPRMIPYRGHDNRLWARDFAGEILDRFPDLKLSDYGFIYHRAEYPQDDLTFFLMEKPSAPADGWKQIGIPEGARSGLCHSDGPWWKAPDGTELCGTCHPTPWLGWTAKEIP